MATEQQRPQAASDADLAVQQFADQKDHEGWIDVPVCEELISKPHNFICAVDGSDPSWGGFHYLTEGLMQRNKDTYVEVVHVFDDSKSYLPPNWRPDAVRNVVESKITGALSQKRYRIHWTRKEGRPVAVHLNERAKDVKADFCVMGFVGRKGKKDRGILASNVQQAIMTFQSTIVVMKDEDLEMLPVKRPAKFVVSVSLNQASTKAFLDALSLSGPGDEVHVVYVKSFMERTDSDYTHELREKYSGFFDGLQDGKSKAFSKFQDRKTQFVMLQKGRRETTAQAVVRYGDEIEADFMVVGTNTLRVQRGKKPIGSVSLDICMEWDRNFVVSHWLDLRQDLKEQYGTRDNAYHKP